MKTHRLIIVLGVIAAVAAVCLAAAPGAEPTAVGVVDVNTVFHASREWAAITVEFKNAGADDKAKVEETDKEIKKLNFELEQLIDPQKNPQQYGATQVKLRRMLIDRNVATQFRQSEAARRMVLRNKALYNKLAGICGELALENGFHLILFKETENLAPFKNHTQLVNQIASRKVIWSAPELDITDRVVERLNAAWSGRFQ